MLRMIIYNHPVWWFYRREACEVHEEYTPLVTAIIVEISATSSNKWRGTRTWVDNDQNSFITILPSSKGMMHDYIEFESHSARTPRVETHALYNRSTTVSQPSWQIAVALCTFSL